jgi:APA family basic amino acid/polyamine antiporter
MNDSRAPGEAAAQRDHGLVRAIGLRQFTASIVNVTVGAGIFVLPAAVSMQLGAAAPAAYLVCAVAMALIVASFALAGSRVSVTGGIYAYVEAAFGPFVGVLAGAVQYLVLWLTAAGLLSAFADQVSLLVPGAGQGLARIAVIFASAALLAFVNVRGVKPGARLVEGITVAKLLPLALLIGAGLFAIDPAKLAWPGWPASEALGSSVLLLIFAFAGIEVALVPSGEVRDPARTVPRAVGMALCITTTLYLAVQAVAQGVLGSELQENAAAPLAAVGLRLLGETGRLLVLLGGSVSMFGYLSGDMLASPRSIFAFGRDALLPGFFASVHERFRTPHVAIATHATLIATLAASSQFTVLALLSNVGVLSLYFAGCAAALRFVLRGEAPPGALRLPGERLIPVLAMGVILWILAHATLREIAVLAVTLAAATVLYLLRRARMSR